MLKQLEFSLLGVILSTEKDEYSIVESISLNYKRLLIENLHDGAVKLETYYKNSKNFLIKLDISYNEKKALREAMVNIDREIKMKKKKKIQKKETNVTKDEDDVERKSTDDASTKSQKKKTMEKRLKETSENASESEGEFLFGVYKLQILLKVLVLKMFSFSEEEISFFNKPSRFLIAGLSGSGKSFFYQSTY